MDDQERLGPELGPIFNALWDDLSWLQVKWSEYREMFGTSEERIHSLNSTAGFFFGMLQRVLYEDILLNLCRLTDPAKVSGKSTLTVQLLPDLCVDQSLHLKVIGLVRAAVDATIFARDWRNRWIAHSDLDLAQDNRNVKRLAPASRAQISEAVRAIYAILNHISEALSETSLAKEVLPTQTGSAALLQLLGVA